MASTSRPMLRSSTSGRFAAAAEHSPIAAHLAADTTPIAHASTRRSLPHKRFSSPDSPDPLSIEPPPLPQPDVKSPSRTVSRKRKATSISDDTTTVSRNNHKPPTKVTVAQPHGPLLETVNGVQRQLTSRENDVGSQHQQPSPTASTSKQVNGTIATPNNVRAAKSRTVAGEAVKSDSASTDKRTLRSQDGGSRLKSDLAIYFANYDDVITDAPQEPEFLSLDTPIHVVDDASKHPKARSDATHVAAGRSRSKTPLPRDSTLKTPITSPNAVRTTDSPAKPSSTTYQVVDFSTINRNTSSVPTEDPLGDAIYFAPHRRAERKEKQLRNIEKERAMHEKVQLERLLEGLQGPDWLKVMGITGITDGERKEWEPKRNYFINEVKALVDKFRQWKEAEKRLKMEKEALLHAQEEDEEEEEEDEEDEEGSDAASSAGKDAEQSTRQESSSASTPLPKLKIRLPPALPAYLPPAEVDPNKPFTSFYAKPHLRAAALGQHRHGRASVAFGHTIPDFTEAEFHLPRDYLTPEALKDHARKKRRLRREQSASNLKRS